MRKIITVHIYPPISQRFYDWCAYREGDEEISSKYGWGSTEAIAIADLEEREADYARGTHATRSD
jgi:hypothetical protein